MKKTTKHTRNTRKNKTKKCKNIGSVQFEVDIIKKRIELVKANNLKNSMNKKNN
jgi:hypothetical protein